MNKERRKAIEDVRLRLDAARADIEQLKDDEQSFYDNMPDAFRDGQKGDTAQEAIDNLDEAMCSVDEAMSKLEDAAQ